MLKGQSKLQEQVSAMAAAVNRLFESQRRLEIATTAEGPLQLRRDVVASLQNVLADKIEGKSLDYLPSKLTALEREATRMTNEIGVVGRLKFDTIWMRQERIAEAYPATFEWIFPDTKSLPGSNHAHLADWLRRGNGIYWVSGKAGSGKSTFMKWLHSHKECLAALQDWAGGRQLVTSSFFFWNAGNDMQKSQQGLLQTLLYHILRQQPELVPSVFPSRWVGDESAWTFGELLRAFENLQNQTVGSVKFCFFIDGLDEYDGDHRTIIDFMEGLTSGGEVKICFSSRPWNVFERAYGDRMDLKLRLQDLTAQDIEDFVKGKLAEDRHFRQLRDEDIRYNYLAADIVDRSQGVFLWVVLVVQSLRRGMTNSDTVPELQERLSMLPTDLESYFQHMLDSVEKSYQKQAARIYLMRLLSPGELHILTVLFFDEPALDFGLKAVGPALNEASISDLCARTKTRVIARCTDLLEVSDSFQVEYLHRTVYDFLETQNVRKSLNERAGAEFDADYYFCNALLVRAKKMSRDVSRRLEMFFLQSAPLVDCFIQHAFRLDVRGDSRYCDLFEELGRIFTPLLELREQQTPIGVWCLEYGRAQEWLSLMAIRRGLHTYVSKALPKERIKTLIKPCNQPPPLLVALVPSSVFTAVEVEADKTRFPDLRVVEFLLDQGAHPDDCFLGRRIFEYFMRNLIERRVFQSSKKEKSVARDLVEERRIVQALLSHGGDPRTCWSGSEGPEKSGSRDLMSILGLSREDVYLGNLSLQSRQAQERTPSPPIRATVELPSHFAQPRLDSKSHIVKFRKRLSRMFSAV